MIWARNRALTWRRCVLLAPLVLLHAGLVLSALWVVLDGQGAGLAPELIGVLAVSLNVAAILAIGLLPAHADRWRVTITLVLALIVLFGGLSMFWRFFL